MENRRILEEITAVTPERLEDKRITGSITPVITWRKAKFHQITGVAFIKHMRKFQDESIAPYITGVIYVLDCTPSSSRP